MSSSTSSTSSEVQKPRQFGPTSSGPVLVGGLFCSVFGSLACSSSDLQGRRTSFRWVNHRSGVTGWERVEAIDWGFLTKRCAIILKSLRPYWKKVKEQISHVMLFLNVVLGLCKCSGLPVPRASPRLVLVL